MCPFSIYNEGHSSSTAIGLSNDCQWVVNEVSSMPWCHVVVHFELKMSGFPHFRPFVLSGRDCMFPTPIPTVISHCYQLDYRYMNSC